jgi:tetratricopeptide (TPR) repeat protein
VLVDSPGHVPSLVVLAGLYQGRRNWVALDTALGQLPDSPHRRAKRAFVAELAGRLDEALALWQPLSDTGVGLAQRGVARVLARKERWPELAARYEADVAAKPSDLHARWRAAELCAERLSDEDRVAHLLGDSMLRPSQALVLLMGRASSTAPAPTQLARAAEGLDNAALRSAVLAELAMAVLFEAEGPERIARWLATAPANAVTAVHREQLDEARCDRAALIEHLRAQSQDPTDADAAAQADVRLARLLDELGASREALDALERAVTSLHPPLTAFLLMPPLYAALDDRARFASSLAALAEALPEGELRSVALRRLAGVLRDSGDRERAAGTLEWALRGDPRDFAALRELASLVDAEDHERLLAPLLRAWEQEPAGPQRLALGLAAAVRLIRLGRYDGARDALERVQAEGPDHLPALLARAELEARAVEWPGAVVAWNRIVAHPEADEGLRRTALRRLLEAQLGPAPDVEGALRSSKALCELTGSDAESLALAYRAAEAAGAHEDAIKILEGLVERNDVGEDDRARYELELAARLEQHRGDALKAIEILGRIRVQDRRREAIERLMALGEKSNRWDVAAVALEKALERPGGLEVGWEVAIRSRLAALLEGPLERRDAAVHQYERVVEIDRSQVSALERLAVLTAAEPKKAIVHHRALVAANSRRLESYRALRTLALALGDEDSAFLTEAILEGAGVADEEESYFYQQRRARMKTFGEGSLERADLDLIAPQLRRPQLALLAAVAPVLASVFPVDTALYGVTAGAVPPSASLRELADRVAALLGAGSISLHLVGNRVGPCAELGTPTPLFLSRALDEAPPREQAFVLGEVLGRVAFGLAVGDPRRGSAISPTLLEYLAWAICEIGDESFTSPARGKAVYEDVRRRLAAALDAARVPTLGPLVRAARDGETLDGHAMMNVMEAGALRFGLFVGQDPAVAIAAVRQRQGVSDKGLDALPPALCAALPFVVSAEHAALRRRLGMGVV